MKKTLFGFLVTSLTTLSLTSFAAGNASEVYEKAQIFKGNFSYSVSGEFNGPLGSGKLTEVGLFKFDGAGNVTANSIVNLVNSDLSIALPSGHVSYNCTYPTDYFAKAEMLLMHCIRHQANFTPQDQNLDLVLAGVKNSPVVKIQAVSGGTFGNVHVSGEGTRAVG